MLTLLGGMLFSALALILVIAYFVTGSKKMILLRLAGTSAIIASLIWIFRSNNTR
ncbi:MAG: hypothetical protein ICV68_11705 [Pyrinomonadaceae bacterium]|nr:hypothetical protein [Pyrinomonadaceae bacterium]